MTHSPSDPLVRTNVTLPASVLEQVDRIAGERGRSRYVAEAVAQRVRRDELGSAIRDTAGVMVGRPGWMSHEEIDAMIEDLRSEETDAVPARHDTRRRPRQRP
jgi:metal-responsive CopG/Arc/MetJ family transcriptional regulator